MNPAEEIIAADKRLRELCESRGVFQDESQQQRALTVLPPPPGVKMRVSLTQYGGTDQGTGDTSILAMIDLTKHVLFGDEAASVRPHRERDDKNELRDVEDQLTAICHAIAGDRIFEVLPSDDGWEASFEDSEHELVVAGRGATGVLAMIEFIAEFF